MAQAVDGLKVCVTCKAEMPVSEFYPNKALRDGLFSECKDCHKARGKSWRSSNRDRCRENGRAWRKANPDKYRASKRASYERHRERVRHKKVGYRLKRLGLTREDADRIVAEQGGVCAICGNPPDCKRWKKLYADHDHKTGAFRAFLCSRCNSVIGMADEDVEVLAKMIAYLKHHHARRP